MISITFANTWPLLPRRSRPTRERLDGEAEGGAQKAGVSPPSCGRSSDVASRFEVNDQHAPVRSCHRYLSARANHLNYRQALADGLPLGSGEIESAHRHVAQRRLKRPGVWWRVEHAEYRLTFADKPNQRRLERLLESLHPTQLRRRQ
ncbi:hypothetical protein [Rhodoblastus sp.]|uniref:hypothetical protein n=1 Tax=Rhodoblastus sp. TaxID=1962975 RepID=UPI003F9B74AB